MRYLVVLTTVYILSGFALFAQQRPLASTKILNQPKKNFRVDFLNPRYTSTRFWPDGREGKIIFASFAEKNIGWARIELHARSQEGLDAVAKFKVLEKSIDRKNYIKYLVASPATNTGFFIKAIFVDKKYCRMQGDTSEEGNYHVWLPWTPCVVEIYYKQGRIWKLAESFNAKSDSDYFTRFTKYQR